METRVLREISPLSENDFMYVADRHKKEFDYPIHVHDVLELNFVANAAGARRVVGDSSETIGDLDLVLITSPDLEHVWEQHECAYSASSVSDFPTMKFRFAISSSKL